MKSKKLFAVVVFVVLAALGCAMSAAAEDAVFTCDSDPADFNGKLLKIFISMWKAAGKISFSRI